MSAPGIEAPIGRGTELAMVEALVRSVGGEGAIVGRALLEGTVPLTALGSI